MAGGPVWELRAVPPGEPLTEAVRERLMMGLSTRNYGKAVREFTEAYGLDKSTVSERFIEASRGKLKAMMERRLDGDASARCWSTPLRSRASRWWLRSESASTGVLGLRQGTTENATVVARRRPTGTLG
jgi:hypothetical protein